jgi:hypothetical protein
LTALFTHLRIASGNDLTAIRRCAERLQAITELARELSAIEEASSRGGSTTTNVVHALESASARVVITLDLDASGELVARVAPGRAVTITAALLRAVMHATTSARLNARVARRDDRIWVRIDPGIEPATWSVVEPWHSGSRHKLDLWGAAVAAGEDGVVRVGEQDGQIAVELELPAAEAQ